MFPAPAGINRTVYTGFHAFSGVPRASGDKPELLANDELTVECSPRQRG
ncbi:hypothetical protein UPM260_2754 [Salmonella enterica subsp. enterica serovar Typhimurium]|nr:hypothetical protein AX05_36720 [Salmonella enterica subsp. enterica serovar Typhimurium str. CDC 2011K-0870]VUG00954.1 hypothetical protein UPM260_2754 [Salmonella enterica subsp. enterica serovar Typhimurium]